MLISLLRVRKKISVLTKDPFRFPFLQSEQAEQKSSTTNKWSVPLQLRRTDDWFKKVSNFIYGASEFKQWHAKFSMEKLLETPIL